jgi:protein involved in polysaccharide export with SLBB domain
LSDILNRAGGFTSLSNIKGVSLRRRVSADDPNADIRRSAAKKLFSTKNDSSAFTALIDSVEAYETVAIDVEEILKRPKSSIDILLQDGDIVNVPSKDDVVKVKGEVLLQTQIAYIPNRRLSYYIDLAGGFSTQAQKRKAFVVASNGNGKRVKSFLIFKSNPIINAGDEIFVPKKLERDGKRVSVAEMVGITTALASVATVVIALLRL